MAEYNNNISNKPRQSDDYILTVDDFEEIQKYLRNLIPPKRNKNPPQFTNQKLLNYKSANPPNHVVNITDKMEVFVTSDIHADYRKFVQILVAGGFIRIPNVGDLYEENNIYNFSIISECEWIKSNCLIVIAGDLVDGNRPVNEINNVKKKEYSVDDYYGCFELFIHMLIFNLRIKGQETNSNILFTIGNHDLETVIVNTDILSNHIHKTSLQFFGNKNIRSMILKEFYELNPYIYLVLSTPNMNNEVAILHGGLHDQQGNQFLKEGLEELQSYINQNGLKQITSTNNTYLGLAVFRDNNASYDGALWTRFYADSPISSCLVKSEYALTVVGHCPTNLFSQLSDILDRPDYYGCDSYKKNKMKGCVILNCINKLNEPVLGLPRIALVDASISSAFSELLGRHRDLEKVRGIELLHLQHVDRNTPRWFNDISRFEINFNCNKTRDIRPSQTGGSKNYKDKYLIYKMKYLKLQNKVL